MPEPIPISETIDFSITILPAIETLGYGMKKNALLENLHTVGALALSRCDIGWAGEKWGHEAESWDAARYRYEKKWTSRNRELFGKNNKNNINQTSFFYVPNKFSLILGNFFLGAE